MRFITETQRLAARMSAVFLCALCVSAVTCLPLLGQEDRTLAELRKKGDRRQVERYCREQLTAKELSLDRRAELTSELAASLAQQAHAAPDDAQSEKLWNEADQLLAMFLKEHPAHARSILMLRQRAIYRCTHGETLRQQGDILASDELLAKGRLLLQDAEKHATALETAVTERLEAYDRKTDPKQEAFSQLVALSNDSRFRLAQIRLSLAQTLPSKHAERGQLLAEAIKGFKFYTDEGYSEDELIVRSHLGLAECLRLQEKPDEALRALRSVEESPKTAAPFKDDAIRLKMNIYLDQKLPHAAKGLVQGRSKLPPEMALAYVHALMLESKLAAERKEPSTAARLQAEALQRIDVGEREFGPGWLYRAGLLLGRYGDAQWTPDDVKGTARLGEGLLRAKRWDQAAEAYERAATLARQAKDVSQAFEFSLRAAAAMAQAGKNLEAADALLKLAASAPEHMKAPQAQILAAHALRRAWEKDPSPDMLQRLKKLLADHLRRYSTDDTAGDAHFLAGFVASVEGQWRSAIDHYAQVPVRHRLFPEALHETVRAYEFLIRAADHDRAESLAREALGHLARREKDLPGGPETASLRRSLSLAGARLRTRPVASAHELRQARKELEGILKDSMATPSEHAVARQTMVLILAGLQAKAEALRLLEQVSSGEQGTMPAMHRQLGEWLSRVPEETRPMVAALHLSTARRLLADPKVPADQAMLLRRDEAWALAHLGEYDEARRLFAKLREDASRDAWLAEEHARALMHMGSKDDLLEAVKLWQALAASRKDGTADWFEAKYQLAVTLHRSGQTDRALKVVRVTYELWLKEPEDQIDETRRRFQARFKELEAQLRR